MHCLVRHVQDHEYSYTVVNGYRVIEHSALIGLLECAKYLVHELECTCLAHHGLTSAQVLSLVW